MGGRDWFKVEMTRAGSEGRGRGGFAKRRQHTGQPQQLLCVVVSVLKGHKEQLSPLLPLCF